MSTIEYINKKSDYICKQCSRIKDCKYYEDIIYTISKFETTPLSISFTDCSEYSSALCRFVEKLEEDIKIVEYNPKIHNQTT